MTNDDRTSNDPAFAGGRAPLDAPSDAPPTPEGSVRTERELRDLRGTDRDAVLPSGANTLEGPLGDTGRISPIPNDPAHQRGEPPAGEPAMAVCGRVGTWDEADVLKRALLDDGFGPSDIEVFYTGPSGRHGMTPIGGDSHADAGATQIAAGGTAGGAIGGAAGLAVGAVLAGTALPVAGAVIYTAAAVGAFGGALAGGVAASKDGSAEADTAEHPVAKVGGVVVAVRTDQVQDGESRALAALKRAGAIGLERAPARWADGSWVDWDPTAPREQMSFEADKPQA